MEDQSPAAVVKALYDAFERGDHARILSCLAEGLRWRQAATAVPAAGEDRAGARALLDEVIRPLERDWDGFTEEISSMLVGPDHVVATGAYRGTYRATGRTLNAEFCHVWTVDAGIITEFRQYTDTAAFVTAMGDDSTEGDDVGRSARTPESG